MGGFDLYCVVCGAGLSSHGWDPEVLPGETTAWMEDIRLIGQNPEKTSINKAFISGRALYDDSGFFDVEPGDDPNFPTVNQIDYNRDGLAMIRGFDWEESIGLVVPFHTACHQLLQEDISHWLRKRDRVNTDVLYQTLKSFADENDECANCLNRVDYGEISKLQDQYWGPQAGDEVFGAHPIAIPELETYYKDLPLLTTSKEEERQNRWHLKETTPDRDPFAKLAPELLLMVLDNLPIPSLNSARAASCAIARLKLDNGFWYGKIRHDMAWLYDLPKHNAVASQNLDWAQVYQDLLSRSQSDNQIKVEGLVNRRRVWGICDQIAAQFSDYQKAADDRNGRQCPILAEAISTRMARLAEPEQADDETASLLLIGDFPEMDHPRPTICVYWSSEGFLSGLRVRHDSDSSVNPKNVVGKNDNLTVCNEVAIKHGDWLRGLIVTTHLVMTSDKNPQHQRKIVGLQLLFARGESIQLGDGNGDARLVHVKNDLLVGLIAQWSPAGNINGISLLQCPVLGRSAQAEQLIQLQMHQPYAGSDIDSLCWRDGLPPSEMTLETEHTSNRDPGNKEEMRPMETLIFGHNQEELSTITEISCDVQFGAFEVRYSDQTVQSIGPRTLTMKSLKIDGSGGERIVAIGATTKTLATTIWIGTNRNRQLVVGSHAAGPASMNWRASEIGKAICGLSCFWSSASPQSQLVTVAPLFISVPTTSSETGPAELQQHSCRKDKNGYLWEPEPPPSSWTETGPIYCPREVFGSRIAGSLDWPSKHTTLTWLDCTQSVEKLRLVFAHPTAFLPFSPTSIILEYSDGSVGSVGPTRVATPTDSEGKDGRPWCWCHMASKSDITHEFHYHSEEWTVGGVPLDCIRLWVDNGLHGFQFCSANGESPLWGTCDGQPTETIPFGLSAGQAVGLKAYVDSNSRPVTYKDQIIVALQALAPAS
ncbi:hypothetical protein NUU61_008754 [Penicillium alfredii]|uniref:F-box domain-containing protein n=1 Tax=Penicillium alfredii TaxID=1506179 RepID=A0A9W9ELY4_9EURO|nr:uncharacterized protein NUU61_008754 [Penicillium alfredii]KAJ5084175.1 hypothetical protein NUU61_008754 [Penicillium alfredii]